MKVLCVGEAMAEFARAGADGLWRRGFAGDVLNVAWGIAALSGTVLGGTVLSDPAPDGAVGLLSRVGDDPFSHDLLRFLDGAGIGRAHVAAVPGATLGLYAIETDDEGERAFTYWRGQSAARGLADEASALREAFEAAELVFLSGITLAIVGREGRRNLFDALGRPGQRPFLVAFDSNLRPRLWDDPGDIRPALEAAFAASDLVLPTHDDERAVWGDRDARATLERHGGRDVVVKDGAGPTLFSIGGEEGAVPVGDPVRPLDTTGAGDAFDAALIVAWLQGLAPRTAVARAQAVARLVVQHPGALAPVDALRAAWNAARRSESQPVPSP